MLNDAEQVRYQRQIMMPEWGEAGQQKLKEARVVIVGAGGLGSATSTYLAVAGVGKIKIIDNDVVEPSNLNRQILHTPGDIGRKKVDSAKASLLLMNPDIEVATSEALITQDNVSELVSNHLIVDALDNLPARYLLNKVALKENLPLFHGAVYGFEGRVTTILPGKTACLGCLYQGVVPGRTPVVGVTPGIIGCIQATEVIKHILGIGDLLANRLLIYDGLSMTFHELKLKPDPKCPECQSR